jgi:hypothetical protein
MVVNRDGLFGDVATGGDTVLTGVGGKIGVDGPGGLC